MYVYIYIYKYIILREDNRDPHKYVKHTFHENGVTEHTNDGTLITQEIKISMLK
jgi:hypothetical protein